jgi:hypothetical protein
MTSIGEDCGYCIWLWDGNKWIMVQNHCKSGCIRSNPNKGPLEIRGRKPCQMYQFNCSRDHRSLGLDIDYGYTVCQYDGTQWVPIQDNCINGGVQNCGSSRSNGAAPGDIESFPCLPPGRSESAPMVAHVSAGPCGGTNVSDIELLLQSWSNLPSTVRTGIMAMVRAGQ